MHYDIIVIGAGLGGLTVGAKLAREGKQVLLIEQHNRPGGCATTFQREDFIFEVGLHEMDGLDARDMKTRIFNDLGVFDQVEFVRVPEFYHFIHGNNSFTMPHDPVKAATLLTENFPQEEQGIQAFYDRLINARKWGKESEGKPEISLGTYLDGIISNDELKLILLGNLGYFHDDPYTLSLNYYATAQGSYFRGGGNFIKGGSQKLSNYLANTIENHGGTVLLSHLVTGINIEDHRATGVTYHPKGAENLPAITATAGEIIANAAIPNVARQLLPEPHSSQLASEISELAHGASLLTLYLGFNKPLKEIGNRHYSTFVFDESIQTMADIRENNRGDFNARSFTFVDYSQVDSGLAPSGKSVGVVCCIDYMKDWENLSRDTYKVKKEEVAELYLQKLEKLIPGIRGQLAWCEVGTSKTVSRYTLNPNGAVYGFAQTPERVALRPFKPIDHLHFASAWTKKTGGGFSGAIFSGYLCAIGLLRR